MKKNITAGTQEIELNVLTKEETDLVTTLLGREANAAELKLYTIMWQEKLSHKNTIYHIKRLPKEGPQVLIKPGDESTGFIDIGDGLACTARIITTTETQQKTDKGELELYASGAKPVLSSRRMRFGKFSSEKTTVQLEQLAIPAENQKTAHADTFCFDEFHERELRTDAIVVGLARSREVVTGIARGAGNPVFLAISDDEAKLKAAIKEIIRSGAASGTMVIGQGGIIQAAAAMAAKGKTGISIQTENLPGSCTGNDIIEKLVNCLSYAMLIVCEKSRESEIALLLKFSEVHCSSIGTVVAGDSITIRSKDKTEAILPVTSLLAGQGAPVYRRESKDPEYHLRSRKFNIDSMPQPGDLRPVVRTLLSQPDIQVYLRPENIQDPASDTVHFQIPDSEKQLLASVCCRPRYTYTDPRTGTEIAVAEAARRIICQGGRPLAIAASLHFGDTDDPAKFWQYVQSAKGLNNACRKFNLVVTRCEAQFNNSSATETESQPALPEPVIGIVGVIDDKLNRIGSGFKNKGDVIFLLGESRNDINSSQYLVSFHKVQLSPAPYFNPDKEFILQHHVHGLIQSRLINSAQSISGGGLFTALVKSGFQRDLGFDITTDSEIREDAFLFGEAQSRVIVTVGPENESDFIDYMFNTKIQATLLGHVTRGAIRVDDVSFGFIKDMKNILSRPLAGSGEVL